MAVCAIVSAASYAQGLPPAPPQHQVELLPKRERLDGTDGQIIAALALGAMTSAMALNQNVVRNDGYGPALVMLGLTYGACIGIDLHSKRSKRDDIGFHQ